MHTSLSAYHFGLPPGTTAAQGQDQFGEMLTLAGDDLTYSVSRDGSHLVQASKQMVGEKAVYTVNLTGTLDAFAANDHSYSGGAGGYAKLDAGIKPPNYGTLAGSCINKDAPTNTAYQALPSPLVLYGGSVPFTSDELLLNAADSNSVAGTTYTWYVEGPGAYSPPSGGPTWNVVIPATPGTVTFECLVQPPGVVLPTTKILTVELGIRTDDVIVIGWIDATGVTVPSGAAALAAGVDPQVLNEFAPGAGSGPPGSDPAYPFYPAAAAAAIVALAQNDDCIDFELQWPSHVYSQADKDYILKWLFKYSPNPDPTPTLLALQTTDWTNPNVPLPTWNNPNPVPVNTSSDFTCYDGYMDYIKYQAYLADAHHFKLLNHFQVKYRVNLANTAQFNGTPIALQRQALIGATVNPTGIPPDLGPGLALLTNLPPPYNLPYLAAAYANNTLLNPQAGPANGSVGEDPNQTLISQSNDGSPDIPGIRAFNTLMALDVPTPLFWQNIGSKITFKCGATIPNFTYENYPTYYFYVNGILNGLNRQAKAPQGYFFANAYPFGTYPTYGLPPQWPWGLPVIPALASFPTIQGGRNGVATTPGDSSSPTPAYTVP